MERSQDRDNAQCWPLPSRKCCEDNRRTRAGVSSDSTEQRKHGGEVGVGKENRRMGNAMEVTALTYHALLFLNEYQIL